jgi:hypothetical protein
MVFMHVHGGFLHKKMLIRIQFNIANFLPINSKVFTIFLFLLFDSPEIGLQPGHFLAEIGFSIYNREIHDSFGLKLT